MSKESALQAAMGQPITTPTEAMPLTSDLSTTETQNLPKDELQSQRLAIFAKKEAAIQKEREQLKRDREEWMKDKAIADQYKQKGMEFDELRKKDPIAAMKMIGMTETEIVNFMNSNGEDAPKPEDIARKIAQEESQKVRDELKAQAEAQQKAKNDSLVAGLKTDIKDTIKAQADKYEYCAFEGVSAEKQAYEIIVENLKENGELLTVDQALEIAEEYYESRDKAMSALKKRQPKVEASIEPTKTSDIARRSNAGKPPVSNTTTKTLTNSVAATAAGAATQGTRRETSAEKRQRLINALSSMGKG